MTDESRNRSIQNSELTTKKNNKWMNQQPNEIKDDYAKGWIQRMTEGMKGWIYLDWVWRGKVFALRASASALNI